MGCRILANADDTMACLYDSVTATAFGRVFEETEAAEDKMQAFLEWYAKHGQERDPRIDDNIDKVQDAWAAGLDKGCSVCGAHPWRKCDDDEEEEQHERKVFKCKPVRRVRG
jgi:hypothetical protein